MSLTIKQEKFVLKYYECGNASEAYRYAYNCGRMKPETIHNKAYNLLQKDEIRARLDKLKSETYQRNKATVDETLSLMSDMLRVDIADVLDDNGVLKKLSEIPKAARMAILAIETDEILIKDQKIGETRKVKLTDRTKLADMFLKHFGGYEKNNEQQRSNVVVFRIPDNGRSE